MVGWAPSLAGSVLEQVSTILQFGDWLILSMMTDHLDIKLTTDILNKIKAVNCEVKRHSSISTTLEMLPGSDTDGELEEKTILKSPPVTPASTRRLHPPIIKKVKCCHPTQACLAHGLQSSTATNLVKQLGIDHDLVKEMISDG